MMVRDCSEWHSQLNSNRTLSCVDTQTARCSQRVQECSDNYDTNRT